MYNELRSQIWNAAYGLCNRLRFTNTAGFNHDIVEFASFHQVLDLLNQIRFQSTAYASVLKSHQTVIFLVHNATFLNEVSIYIDLSDVVDNHCKTDSFTIGKYMVDQCSLATAQITGQKQYRHFFICHSLSYEIGFDWSFPFRLRNSCLLSGPDTFEQPCHIAPKFTHDLHALFVLSCLLRSGAMYHVPIFG